MNHPVSDSQDFLDDLRRAEFIENYFARSIQRIKSHLQRRCESVIEPELCSSPVELFGCTMSTLASYLSQWFERMSTPSLTMRWSNYGMWEIDHIQPFSSFKDLHLKQQQSKCFFMLNLRPVWRPDNLRRKRSSSEDTLPTICFPEEGCEDRQLSELTNIVSENQYLSRLKKARVVNQQLKADLHPDNTIITETRRCPGLIENHSCPNAPKGKSKLCLACLSIFNRFRAWRQYYQNSTKTLSDYISDRSIILPGQSFVTLK